MKSTGRFGPRHGGLYVSELLVPALTGMPATTALLFSGVGTLLFLLLLYRSRRIPWESKLLWTVALLIASGIIQAIGLISARHAPNFWLQIISAILGVLLGILLLRNIAQGMLLLSLLLIIFFMIGGMSKVVFALTIRPLPNWLWVFASGVLSVVLSLVLFAAMPVTALWLIGLMLGLDLIAIGAALGAMAWRLRGQAVPAA